MTSRASLRRPSVCNSTWLASHTTFDRISSILVSRFLLHIRQAAEPTSEDYTSGKPWSIRADNAIPTLSWASSVEFAPNPVALFSTQEVASSTLSAAEHTDGLTPMGSVDGEGLEARGQENELELEVLEERV